MIKLVALYRVPEDSEAFDCAYFQAHLPLLASTPGLQRTEVARVTRLDSKIDTKLQSPVVRHQ